MQQVELCYLIDTQLDDLLHRASDILSGNDDDTALEEFYKRSAGVKRFMNYYVAHSGIQKFLRQIPHIDYKKSTAVEKYLLWLPFTDMRKKKQLQKSVALAGVREALNIYSTIYYLHEANAA